MAKHLMFLAGADRGALCLTHQLWWVFEFFFLSAVSEMWNLFAVNISINAKSMGGFVHFVQGGRGFFVVCDGFLFV